MSSRELGPEWVLSAFLQNAEARGQDDVSELAIVAAVCGRGFRRTRAKSWQTKRPMTRWFCDGCVGVGTAIRRKNHASVKWKRPADTEPGGLSLRSLSPSLQSLPEAGTQKARDGGISSAGPRS